VSAPASNVPTLQKVENDFDRVWLDHISDWVGRSIHPSKHMPDYGASMAIETGEAALRLMLNDSLSEKMPALINYLQFGIDLKGMFEGAGSYWPPNGGHDLGRKLPLAFAAVLFDDASMKNIVASGPPSRFQEDGHIYFSQKANNGQGVVLAGDQTQGREDQYWQIVETGNGFRTARDPYGYIDGGPRPGESYLFHLNSDIWEGPVVAMKLMPALTPIWNNTNFSVYVERYHNLGEWSQPDPCAPYDGNPSNRSITYGPDGSGGCILDTDSSDGIGRFPNVHGTNPNGATVYVSRFFDEMWNLYFK